MARVDTPMERPLTMASTRPSDPAVRRAFLEIDPTELPTRSGGVVDGREPAAVLDRCQEVTGELCRVLERLGVDACEIYLFIDHRLRRVELSRACAPWRREAAARGRWGHVVLGVPGRRGGNPSQLPGPHGAVELWDWTARQYDWAAPVPHLVDLDDWGPYEHPRRPTCRRSTHRIDDDGLARCLLPDPLLQRYLSLA